MPLVAVVTALLVLLPTPVQAAARWVWPLAGAQQVSRPFALGPTVYAAGHRGADLPGTVGQPVLAAGAGRISYAGVLAGRDVLVVVHGSLRTTYEPVRATVGVGQPVTAGQQIGTLMAGHAGCPVRACLHWGLRRGAAYLDPVRLVRGGPVRLLPMGAPASSATGPPSGQGAGRVAGPAGAAGAAGAAGTATGRPPDLQPSPGGSGAGRRVTGAGATGPRAADAPPGGAVGPPLGGGRRGDTRADGTGARGAAGLMASGPSAGAGACPAVPLGAGLVAAAALLAVRRRRRSRR